MMRPHQQHLILFTKAPRLGTVKTRLAKRIGAFKAWQCYKHMLRATTQKLGRQPLWQTYLAVNPDAFASQGRFWPGHLPRVPQTHGDLGRRMTVAMAQMPPGPVLLIGCDIPGVQAKHIRQAFNQLRRNDVVFGPAKDGGFWLVGWSDRRVIPQLFEAARWSHPETLQDCLAPLKHYKVALAETLDDLDH